jgi:hypothetical protein
MATSIDEIREIMAQTWVTMRDLGEAQKELKEAQKHKYAASTM